MKNKTEIDLHFDYYDNKELVKYHNQNICLVVLFSVPLIGQCLLVLALAGELLYKALRIVKLMVKGVWYFLVKSIN